MCPALPTPPKDNKPVNGEARSAMNIHTSGLTQNSALTQCCQDVLQMVFPVMVTHFALIHLPFPPHEYHRFMGRGKGVLGLCKGFLFLCAKPNNLHMVKCVALNLIAHCNRMSFSETQKLVHFWVLAKLLKDIPLRGSKRYSCIPFLDAFKNVSWTGVLS